MWRSMMGGRLMRMVPVNKIHYPNPSSRPQLPIRSRVDSSQFTTPIDFFRFSYELLVELCGLQMYIIVLLYYFICPLLLQLQI